jgi:heme/copper-type cytochrome/quinol oxidase subunit 2
MSLSDNERKKRKEARKRHATVILVAPGIVAALIAAVSWSKDKATLAANAAADHAPHGAAGSAVLGFLGLWVVFVVIVLVIYGLVRAMRRKPEPTIGPPSSRRRRRTGYYPSGR